MNLNHVFVAAIAVAGVQQVAVAQMPSQVSMCITTAIGPCGGLCQPFDCAPNYTLVSSNEDMHFDVAGTPNTPYVLFVGIAVPGCVRLPGIEGALAAWTPAATFHIGVFGSSNEPGLACFAATDRYTMKVPVVIPGVDLRYQMLGVNRWDSGPAIGFSRPIEVRTR
ncbi:MAG: hypothetical protein KDE27_17635 [Planctomycetes bacterium]|nr:hypothetical protein [Planctomycetota bacterium]